MAKKTYRIMPRVVPLEVATAIAFMVAGAYLLAGCQNAPPAAPRPAATQPFAGLHWSWSSARRQVSMIPLPLDLPGTLATVTLGTATGPGRLEPHCGTLLVQRGAPSAVESPVADQLCGMPRSTRDSGSVLLPVEPVALPDGARQYAIPAGTVDIFLRLDLPPTLPPGLYHIPLTLTLAGTAAPAPMPAMLDVNVADITLPLDPPTLAIATCTTGQLAALHKATFGAMQGQYLDRSDPEAAAPMAQLDALTQCAHGLGVCFYVEDIMPEIKVDEVGRVLLDWDAYDRTMGPYIDGTAFSDRNSYAAWLVPVPPRRLRDVPAQLRQYWEACLEHAKDHSWTAVPVLLHPALINPAANPGATAAALQVLRDVLGKDVVVVAAPDVDLPNRKIWPMTDESPRLPSVGDLATPASVRVWPWMAKARGLAGFLWPNCIGAAGANDAGHVALLVPTVLPAAAPGKDGKTRAPLAAAPLVSLRLAWLNAGLNDLAHFALLEKRSDPARAAEVLAAIAGRTGLPAATPAGPDETWKLGHAAFLYAGWPAGQDTWESLDARLDQLILAGTPGATVKIAEDDPGYLKTKIWLARAHQLMARVGGYRFGVETGRDGPLLKFSADLLLENPINLKSSIQWHSPDLPGDFLAPGLATFDIAAYAVLARVLTLQGHLESLHAGQGPLEWTLEEKVGGMNVGVAVPVPVFKMHATREPPKIDARRKDWPEPLDNPLALMPVDLRYLNRPDMLRGQLNHQSPPATVRWCYDADFIYALVECPQARMDDERNNDWPEEDGRWWGTDGIQLHLVGGAKVGDAGRVIQIAIKPSGAVVLRQAELHKDQLVHWAEGPVGVRYSIHGDDQGYTAELAIPRKLFAVEHDRSPDVPVWRVNVLRHIHQTAISTSWSGPLRDDADFSMMGLLVGVGE